MIQFKGVSKSYLGRKGRVQVFDDISFEIPSNRRIAVLGTNGAGKSTLLRLLAKAEYPDCGTIRCDANISWPIGVSIGLNPKMTGRENVRFIGRIYGVADMDAYEQRVRRFARLGKNRFDNLVSGFSSGMRAKLSFGCAIKLGFNMFVLDEATSVGDAKFKRRVKRALTQQADAALMMVSHDMKDIKKFCDSAIILHNGEVQFYDDLSAAIERYEMLED